MYTIKTVITSIILDIIDLNFKFVFVISSPSCLICYFPATILITGKIRMVQIINYIVRTDCSLVFLSPVSLIFSWARLEGVCS